MVLEVLNIQLEAEMKKEESQRNQERIANIKATIEKVEEEARLEMEARLEAEVMDTGDIPAYPEELNNLDDVAVSDIYGEYSDENIGEDII